MNGRKRLSVWETCSSSGNEVKNSDGIDRVMMARDAALTHTLTLNHTAKVGANSDNLSF